MGLSNSSLLKLCYNNNTEAALKLIKSRPKLAGYVGCGNYTPLIMACKYESPKLAIALLDVDMVAYSKPGHVDLFDNTALMYACHNKMIDVVLALLATGLSKPDNVNKYGETALIVACSVNHPIIALTLIATGLSKPEQVPDSGDTALIHACKNNMSEIALALIAIEQSKLDAIDYNNNTPLILACMMNMSEVALALIATGLSKPNHINRMNLSAFDYIYKNDMHDVIFEMIKRNIITFNDLMKYRPDLVSEEVNWLHPIDVNEISI